MSSQDKLELMMAERRKRAVALREAGHHPFRNDVGPSTTIARVRERYEPGRPPPPPPRDPKAPREKKPPAPIEPIDGELVRVSGRVISKRDMGKNVFATIRDTSGQIQLFGNSEHLAADDYNVVLPNLDEGDH